VLRYSVLSVLLVYMAVDQQSAACFDPHINLYRLCFLQGCECYWHECECEGCKWPYCYSTQVAV